MFRTSLGLFSFCHKASPSLWRPWAFPVRTFAAPSFVDRCDLLVSSGKGGRGCVSFARAKHKRVGPPDGGHGGTGGNVYFQASALLRSLRGVGYHHRAGNGLPGGGDQCHGRSGTDCNVKVPVGTIVYNKETGEQIADLSVDGETVLIASGGRGGPGNMAFVSGSTRSPRIAIEGQPGTEITLQLDLKTIADAAFVGLPNAGKSSLLAQLTRAAPKVADYPFTTLQPYVGFMDRSDFRAPVTIADIPGLVEGAHANRGLGHRFLRHVQRAQLLVLVVDASQDMKDQVSMLLEEMDLFDTELVARAQIVVANKVDLIPDRSAFSKRLATIRRRYPDASCVAVSATTGEGIDDLKLLIEKRVSSPVE